MLFLSLIPDPATANRPLSQHSLSLIPITLGRGPSDYWPRSIDYLNLNLVLHPIHLNCRIIVLDVVRFVAIPQGVSGPYSEHSVSNHPLRTLCWDT